MPLALCWGEVLRPAADDGSVAQRAPQAAAQRVRQPAGPHAGSGIHRGGNKQQTGKQAVRKHIQPIRRRHPKILQ